MTLKETAEILQKVDMHYRNSDSQNDYVVKEWCAVLKDYDYVDVLKKLEDHLKSDNHFYYPKPYQLVRYLSTIKAKKNGTKIYKMFCPVCSRPYSTEEAEEHSDRCSSVALIVFKSKIHLNKVIDPKALQKLDDKTFEEKYKQFLILMQQADPNCKKYYKNILLAMDNADVEYFATKELAEQMEMKV